MYMAHFIFFILSLSLLHTHILVSLNFKPGFFAEIKLLRNLSVAQILHNCPWRTAVSLIYMSKIHTFINYILSTSTDDTEINQTRITGGKITPDSQKLLMCAI